jgi:AraC-like DNA-binding protein
MTRDAFQTPQAGPAERFDAAAPPETYAQRVEWTLSGPEAAERYRASMAPLFDVALPDDADFHDHLRGYHLGPALIARRWSSARTLTRTRALARLDGVDSVHVILQVSGTFHGDFEGREIGGGSGAIRVLDMGRPFSVSESGGETIDLSLTRERVDAATGGRDAHGLVFPDRNAISGLLVDHLEGLAQAAPELALAEAAAAADAACALAAGLIGSRTDLDPAQYGPVEGRLFAIARRYIDAQLDSRELTPTAVGAHLGVSRRTLYRLFDGKHGVAGYIQQRRLDRAFNAIAQQAGPVGSLAEIAYAHGFQSEAHFSRAFRARFDMRPGEARSFGQDGRRPVDVTGLSEAAKLLSWLQGL